MKESHNRSFKGVWIPKEIWENKKMSLTERCLLTEILSLDNEKGCYASNKYFSDFFGVSERTITRSIKSLEDFDLISIEYVPNKKGTKRIITARQKFDNPLDKLSKPHLTNCLPNNTDFNNTPSTKVEGSIKEIFPELEIDKVKSTIFRNCDLLKDGVFTKIFEKEIEAGIDVGYYMTKVERWSNKTEGKKRKFYGWRDTVADFMDGDRKSGKLEMSTKVDNTESDDFYLRL